MEENKKSVAIRKYDLASPVQVARMATVLKDHIVKHKLFTKIADKNYVHVEGWQFAGGLIGLYPVVTKVENMSEGNETKWKADVEIRRLKTGVVVGRGFALCSNKETKKKSFDEYAILSMAQTRAIGKAYRNMIGWVMKVAGYEGTPSEEMTKMGETPETAAAETAPAPKGEELFCHGIGKKGCGEGNQVTKQEKQYTERLFGKPLCRTCQKDSNPIRKK